MKTPNWMTKNIKFIKYGLISIVVLFLVYQVGTRAVSRIDQYNTVKANTICPSLLSIGRSARDTLIVMKAEPLCNKYVLDRLR